MNKPLFQPLSSGFTKVAYAVRLPKSTEEWGKEILKSAYKELPYLRRYEVDVSLDRTDEGKGYGVGKMMVFPAGMTEKTAMERNRIVSFPIIINDREVSPLDVYNYEDTFHPANENSIQEVLLKTEMFDGVEDKNKEKSRFAGQDLSAQIDPPTDVDRYSQGGFRKTASVLEFALRTTTTEKVASFREDMKRSPFLRKMAMDNKGFANSVEKILKTEGLTEQEKTANLRNSFEPNAFVIKKKNLGYEVHSTSSECFFVKVASMARGKVKSILPPEKLEILDREGFVSVVKDPVTTKVQVKLASDSNLTGLYSVTTGSKERSGLVIPKVLSIYGIPSETRLALFEDGYAMQEKVAGVYQGEVKLEGVYPVGTGVFVYQRGSQAIATEPVKVLNRMRNGQEKTASLRVERVLTGEEFMINIVPGLQKIAKISEHEVSYPDSLIFVPIKERLIKVASTPKDATELSLLKTQSPRALELIGNGYTFTLRGDSIFAEQDLNPEEMSLALGAHGVHPEPLMKQASAASGPILIPDSRPVFTEKQVLGAAYRFDTKGIACDLIKEASVIVDKESVDSILSLRFVTPENVSMFVSFIPDLEKTASKLAEILTASRLGLDYIKEAAAKNAMNQISKVIKGLKSVEAQIS